MADTKIKKVRQMSLTKGPTYVEGEDIIDILTNELADNRPVQMPHGFFTFSEPLDTPVVSGQQLKGSGRTDVVIGAPPNASLGYSTRLEYTGAAANPGVPAITLRGSEWDLGPFSLCGTTATSTSPPPNLPSGLPHNAEIGMLLQHPASATGLGESNIHAKHISFFGFDIGLQFGETELDYNCDLGFWERCTFRNCRVGLKQKGRFSNEMVMDKCQFRHDLTYGVEICGGGHTTFRNCFVAKPMTFILFSGGNPFQYAVGKNQRNYFFEMLKVDKQATDLSTFVLVETTDTHEARLYFDKLSVSMGGEADGWPTWSEGNIDDNMEMHIINPSYAYPQNVTSFTVANV